MVLNAFYTHGSMCNQIGSASLSKANRPMLDATPNTSHALPMTNRFLLCIALLSCVLPLHAQQRPQPVPATNDTGFELIFDGKTLNNWEGDTNYWRVENGVLVGEVTPDKLLRQNTFIIWRGGETRDFELKVEYRVSARGNSGINYRSVMWTNSPFALRGYQADIDGPNRYTGQNYEEKGRTFLAMRGQVTRLEEGKTPQIIGSLGETNQLISAIKNEEWNEVHIIARGGTMTHIFNGQVMSVVVDDDVKNRTLNGLLGVQVHTGPPMKIEYRNFRLKKLP
jgi:hypothetical protein